jgi:hypothetical protein
VLPPPQIRYLDVELEDVIVIVDDVLRRLPHSPDRLRRLPGATAEYELIIA